MRTRSPSDARDERAGRLVGEWRIERVLGEGATSTVHAATHRDGRRAAIKVLRSALALDHETVHQFRAEGYLVAEIEHPGVVKVHGDGVTEDGCPYLVLELLVGQTLEDLRQTRGGRIPLDEVMPIADAIMDTLIAVHERGITHRDLKPHNVMVLDGGGVKLLDFGLAKVRGRTADAAPSVVGTPSFMPPEQALGLLKKMDAQSDVWALGAVLFYALSGQPVHVARHTSAMLLASASTRPRSLTDAAPELPQAIVDVVDRALSYRKADRWVDVTTMRSAWQTAHPKWLPTLPPPSFKPDPSYVDPGVLTPVPEPAIRSVDTPLAMLLFDPRELVGEEERRSVRAPEEVRAPKKARPRSIASTLLMVSAAILTIGVVTIAAILAADDRPTTTRAATAPPPAMELPPRQAPH